MVPLFARPRRTMILAAAAALVAAAMTASPASAATATGGSGAALPYVEVQAENSATNGTVIGPKLHPGPTG